MNTFFVNGIPRTTHKKSLTPDDIRLIAEAPETQDVWLFTAGACEPFSAMTEVMELQGGEKFGTGVKAGASA